jgi:photosystem II stability/assembly factor-like uncharacterized protein
VARNALWLLLATIAVLGGIVLVLGRDGDDAMDSGAGGFTGGDFHSMVVDPSDPRRIFVGGHQAVSVSTDGGATWTEIEELRDADAMGWAFTDDAIYVSGHPGLSRSTDDAGTFERINEGLPNTDVHAFGGTDDVLYGATPATGVFASDSGVGAWEPRNEAVGRSFFGRILVSADDPDELIAADAAAGVAASDDGGRSWQLLDSGLQAVTWVSRGGEDLETVVASGPAGASMSTDGGETWRLLDVPDGVTLIEAVPGDELLYAGRHDGSNVLVLVSRDGGASWSPAGDPAA